MEIQCPRCGFRGRAGRLLGDNMSKHQTCLLCHEDFVGPDSDIGWNLCNACTIAVHEDSEQEKNEAEERIIKLKNQRDKLREALKEICDADSVGCRRCEGKGMRYEDGKMHYFSESDNAQEIAASALASLEAAGAECE